MSEIELNINRSGEGIDSSAVNANSVQVNAETGPVINVDAQVGGPAGVGVPTGGSDGQVLAKASGTDYDTEWVDQTGGGGGGSLNVSAGATSNNLTNLVFSNSNSVSFGLNSSTITASFSQTVQTQNMVSLLGSTGNVSFGNANGITFGGNASTITASHNALTSQSVQTQGLQAASAGTQVQTSGTLNFINSGGLSWGMSNSSQITGVVGAVRIVTANGSSLSDIKTLQFDNSNGVTFGLSTGAGIGTITASHNGLTTAAASNHSHGNPTLALTNLSGTTASNSAGLTLSLSAAAGGGGADGYNILAAGTQTAGSANTVVFSNSNGLTFGMSNSSVITASHNGITQQSTQPVALSGSNGSFNFSTATFGNLNGMSFYTSNGSMVGSYTVPTQTNQTVGGYFVGNTTGQSSSSTVDARSISIDGAGIVSAGWSNGSIRVSATQSNQAWSGSNASSTFQTLSFNNANGVSWSNNGGAVQASYTVPTLTNSSLTMQAGASTLSSVSRVAFGDGNGVSFGASTSNNGSITITASHNGLTSQSNQNVTAANGGFAFQTLSFSNVNGISFGTSAGSAITASHNALTTARASNDAIGLNTAQSNVTWTVNSAGLSLDARGYAGTGTTFNGANISGSITQNSNGLQLSLSAGAGGGVTPVASASNGSFSFTTLNFSNANNVTFGTSAGSIVTASVAAPGAAAENNWVNLLGANTAGNTTASGSTIGVSGINLTLSGTNGSVYNISAPATSSLSATGAISISTNGSTISIGMAPVTVSRYNEFKESPMVAGAIGQASLHLQPWLVPNLHMDRVVVHNQISNASNSSNSITMSQWVGIYTRNASTLSLLHSTSQSTNFSGSGTVGSYSLYGGIRGHTIGLTQTLTEGMYWVGVILRTTTGGGAGHTINQILNSNINSSYSGVLGVASNATNQWTLGMGVYTASTTAMPGSVAFTQINGQSSVFLRPPSLYFVSGTI